MAENTWVTGVITLLIGVVTLFITGRGPPCIKEKKKNAPQLVPQASKFMVVLLFSCLKNVSHQAPSEKKKNLTFEGYQSSSFGSGFDVFQGLHSSLTHKGGFRNDLGISNTTPATGEKF